MKLRHQNKTHFFCRIPACFFMLSLPLFITAFATVQSENQSKFLIATIDGAINPVAAEYIDRVITRAELEDYHGVILEMDTPGGLLESTRTITKRFLASKVPIIVYVTPEGARAASAGVFISYAAHLVAMAPSTNIGAAHPVSLQGDSGADSTQNAMMDKVTNDAVAQIKGLAEKRNRNAEWAEKTVRESVSITANEALELNVINFITPDIDSLLTILHEKEVEIEDEKITLNTENAGVTRMQMNWRDRILYLVSDPNIAYFFLMAALWGLFFELSNPGAVLPGVIGAISLLLFLYSTQVLPVNYAGLLLVAVSLILFVLEVKITSFGLLTLSGIIAMILGSLMLFESPSEFASPAMEISLKLVITLSLVTAGFFVWALSLALKAHKSKVTTGNRGIVGERGVARSEIHADGRVWVHGEIWSAYSDEAIAPGEQVQVVEMEGLKLRVKKL